MSDLSDKMGDSDEQRRMDALDELRQQFPNASQAELSELLKGREERQREQAVDLSTEGEAGQSATPAQAARGEAADGQPLHGGVAPELEEAADMSTTDGLGKTPEELAQEVSLAAAATRFCETAHKRFLAEQQMVKPSYMYDKEGQMIKQAEHLATTRAAEERARMVFEACVAIEKAGEAGIQ